MKKSALIIVAIGIFSMLISCSQTKKVSGEINLNAPDGYIVRTVHDSEFNRFENFDRDNFDHKSIVIDNEWMPMEPGRQLVYHGHDYNDEDEKVDHKIIYTVTDLVKEIAGIRTVVLYEQDFTEGALEECELAFFAQDKSGNVWHFGQYYEVYEDTEFIGGRMWAVGHLEGAKAGIMMPANPQPRTPSFSQGYAPPPFNWTDRSLVVGIGQRVVNYSGDYSNTLIIEEYNREEPNSFQLKYYAKGVGNVAIGWTGEDESKETMNLVENLKLSKDGLRQVRKEAMALEMRANIYCTTPPAQSRDDIQMVNDN